jgi:chromatin remodeling complex protein RSC6
MSSESVEEYNNQLEECIQKIEFLNKEVKILLTDMKTLKKKTSKITKLKRKREVSPDGSKSVGFKCPVDISDELAAFLDLPPGTSLARSTVTKMIFDYVKDNNLKDTKDGRKFDLSDGSNEKAQALKALFEIKEDEEIGYFTLQRYLKKHLKTKAPATTITAPLIVTDSEESSTLQSQTITKPKIKRKKTGAVVDNEETSS